MNGQDKRAEQRAGHGEKRQELYERLRTYASSDFYPWHMPGHKRRLVEFANPFSIDITEIDGFDDLHHAEGILKEAMEEAAKIYGSEKTYFLVNGSSCGILAAVSAAVKPGGKLLLARNCHKSAYYAALLQQAEVTYLYPKLEEEGFYGAMDPARVEAALKADPEIAAVMLVSPGYEGVVSDIRAIAEIVHAYGCALLVDEAHGAHFPFAGKQDDAFEGKLDDAFEGKQDDASAEEVCRFPESALSNGADVVVQSIHKTLPSLTQTALLHLGKGSSGRIKQEMMDFYLKIYQSSSPSYLLMASIDHCIRLMAGSEGKKLMKDYAKNLAFVRARLLKELRVLQLYEPDQKGGDSCLYDPSKFVIMLSGRNVWTGVGETEAFEKNVLRDGPWLASVLRDRYHLEPEMNTDRYVILMSSPADTKEAFDRMVYALLEIDRELLEGDRGLLEGDRGLLEGIEAGKTEENDPFCAKLPQKAPCAVMKAAFAVSAPGEWISLEKAKGRVCHDFIYIYPPGIPLLVPGEKIEKQHLEMIRLYQKHGMEVQGIKKNEVQCVS